MQSLQLYIGGSWREEGSNGSFSAINPATEKVLYRGPAAGAADVRAAIEATKSGLEELAALTPTERMRILIECGRLLRENRAELARWLQLETGKAAALADSEVELSADQFDWYAGEAVRVFERTAPARAAAFRYRVRREPVGIAAAFVSWNFPLLLLARKLAPAFAAGCPVLIKPAKQGSMAVQLFARIVLEAGFPPNAIALLHGHSGPIAEGVMESFDVRKISFTGSTSVGRQLFRESAATLKKLSLELGGHSPVVIDDDVDLDEVVEPICLLKFRNAGQVCTSPTRFYVAESIFEEFVERFVAVARGLKVGDPLSEDDIDVGPLIGAHRVDAIDRLVNEAVDQGAKLMTGGQRGAGRNIGFYYDPTVLTNVPKEAAIMREEPFGPVALINPVSGFTKGICEANATDYGLAAYAYSRNPAHLDLARAKLEFGVVALNQYLPALAEAPMGGRKASGFGSEGGTEGIGEYLVCKFVHEKASA